MSKKHSISVISNSCGIKPHTIRIWEKRYNLFSPGRSTSGQRLYDDEDLSKAKLVVSLIEYGYAISTLAEYSCEELSKLKQKHQASELEEKKCAQGKQLKNLIDNLKRFEIDLVARDLQYARMDTGARQFVLNLVLPVIREVGNLVVKGKLSISQEHIISTIIRDQLSQISLPNVGDDSFEIALATPEGNLHEFSIIIADILCRSRKLSTRYLGGTHPALCLGEALNILESSCLILGVVSSDQWDYEKKIIPYLKKVDSVLNYELLIILGGGYQIDFPEFKNIKEVIILKTFEEFDQYLEGRVC